MTDYEYIITQLKKCHFSGWDDKVMRDCIDRLPNLSRQELTALYLGKGVSKEYSSKRFRKRYGKHLINMKGVGMLRGEDNE